MGQIKLLPMTYPPVDNVARHAFLLSALYPHEESHPWIYCNYINLAWYDNSRAVWFTSNNIDHFRLPWLETTSLYRDAILRFMPDVESFIKGAIDDNWYVHAKINEFYVEACRSYGKEHLTHNIMVYGYDDDHFYIAGFFHEPLKYGFGEKMRISDFFRAFHDINPEELRNWQVQLFRVPDYRMLPPHKYYRLDMKFMAASIQAFLQSTPIHYYNHADINIPFRLIYGLDLYLRMIELIDLSLADETVPLNFKMFGIYTIYNHKKLMVARIEYLNRQGLITQAENLSESYRRLATLAQRLIVVYARMNKTKDRSLLVNMKKLLAEIHRQEETAMEEMLHNLNIGEEAIL